ncbi:hypothetical protein POM88_048089 [Heracleum sosnowskyi]|uniref:Replication protein A 70 kDa DNA-binding subunit B/D first OB fold domain-containing protein n=1 Tax=Heracleum sosnowskyi TaxID=360622 RepID=A0AAD8GUP2_9APIA|nr:hypothetical protein POM88_048089 [Heracleum sosnowskyi]
MAEEQCQRLQCLNASKTTWKIKVRVTRMWPVMNAEKVFRGQNCLLVDINGNHIQAFVYVDIWKDPKKKLEEGEIYIITNFTVKSAFGKLRPVSSKMAISFTNATEVVHVQENDPLLAMNKFEFVELEDLKLLAVETCPDEPTFKDGEPEFAYDVIGVFEESGGFQMKKTKYGDRPQFKFKISDGRCVHDVTTWGDLASSIKRMIDADDSERKIIIMESTKVVTWKGSHEGTVQTQTEVYTLKDLLNLKDTELIEKEVICRVKISKIIEEYNWYYTLCHHCEKEVNKIDATFKCLLCPRSLPVPDKRFKKKATETFPEELKAIVGKEFTFTITLNEENILNNSDIFYASDLHQQVSILDSESQSYSTINLDDGFNSQEGDATPSNSKGSIKLIKKTPRTENSSNKSSGITGGIGLGGGVIGGREWIFVERFHDIHSRTMLLTHQAAV